MCVWKYATLSCEQGLRTQRAVGERMQRPDRHPYRILIWFRLVDVGGQAGFEYSQSEIF